MDASDAKPITIAARYEGPPGTANGGYVAGLLAASFGPSARVRLEAAVPLASPLLLTARDDEAWLSVGDQRVAVAHADPGPAAPVDGVSFAVAERAVAADAADHPFPGCFVCGPASIDGLHLYPGRVDNGSTVATTWRPDPEGAGLDAERLMWAALDCPAGIAAMEPGVSAVLGTMTSRIARPVIAGETLVVVGRRLALDGRKLFAASALFAADGDAVGWSESVWIVVER
ncbi:MAG TPA: hypothetical protein VID94_00320 [Acidimicrobiales bacterium]